MKKCLEVKYLQASSLVIHKHINQITNEPSYLIVLIAISRGTLLEELNALERGLALVY